VLARFSQVGGWARSHAFIQLRASIFGQRVTVIDELELTAIGAGSHAEQGAWRRTAVRRRTEPAGDLAGDGLGRVLCQTLSRLSRTA
jgi:glycerol kinase